MSSRARDLRDGRTRPEPSAAAPSGSTAAGREGKERGKDKRWSAFLRFIINEKQNLKSGPRLPPPPEQSHKIRGYGGRRPQLIVTKSGFLPGLLGLAFEFLYMAGTQQSRVPPRALGLGVGVGVRSEGQDLSGLRERMGSGKTKCVQLRDQPVGPGPPDPPSAPPQVIGDTDKHPSSPPWGPRPPQGMASQELDPASV